MWSRLLSHRSESIFRSHRRRCTQYIWKSVQMLGCAEYLFAEDEFEIANHGKNQYCRKVRLRSAIMKMIGNIKM